MMLDIHGKFGAGPARVAAALLLAFAMVLAIALGAHAQSSVRPPSNAVTNMTEPTGGEVPGNTLGVTSDPEVWSAIRHGESGKVTIPDDYAATLIQSQGQDWRLLRENYIVNYGAMLILAVVVILMAYFAIRGRIRIAGGRSGKVIPRFSLSERVVHWFTASVFVLLAISGIILLFGRQFLLPAIGLEAFGLVASAAMQGHNLFGPLFLVAIVAMFFLFVRGNGYKLVDLVWAIKAGGLLGGHASSGRYNFGEKSWFWLAIIGGLAISTSGLSMLFPDFAVETVAPLVGGDMAGRELLQWVNIIHAVSAVVLIAVSLGHVYLGTIGMEGALEGMTRGTVDENWAREHHDLWHAEHEGASTEDVTMAEAKAAHGEV